MDPFDPRLKIYELFELMQNQYVLLRIYDSIIKTFYQISWWHNATYLTSYNIKDVLVTLWLIGVASYVFDPKRMAMASLFALELA